MSTLTKQSVKPKYTARLLKAGALLEDMRILVRNWENSSNTRNQATLIVLENLLGKPSRSRALDIFKCAFSPRFINGKPPQAWKIVHSLEERNVPINILRPVYYWITARNEPLLYDFVCEELAKINQTSRQFVTTEEVAIWIKNKLSSHKITWSESVTLGVARKILSILRDFGILQGAVKKKIAPMYLPVEAFAYIAFALTNEGFSGTKLINHPDWQLFLFTPGTIEHMFLEADRHKLLSYFAAGQIVRIEFPANSYEEMANVIAQRTA
ncbi:MAG: DUF1819 family protein [Candidatus Desulfofervidaceae bacterium]|nr:DUF1819 family protein [Candidatus Desulfofervidaceae bacterium]